MSAFWFSKKISIGANVRGVVVKRAPDASDIYCELLRALAADSHGTVDVAHRGDALVRIDDASALRRGDIVAVRRASRETNRNLDIYGACDYDRRARTIRACGCAI